MLPSEQVLVKWASSTLRCPPVTTVMDGYIRVSRVRGRDGESFISPEVQRDQIAAWARLRSVTIDNWETDLDQSGGKLTRPGFDIILERIRTGQTGGIAVARLDRFSRAGVSDALMLIETIEEAGGHVASVHEGVDPTTPFGEFARTLFLALARMERRRIQENWRVAREHAVGRGIHVASQAPTGYIRGDDGRLSPHPEYGPVIRKLFEGRAAGLSWAALARILDEHRVEGPYGPLSWRTRAATQIIRNRVYLGEARSGDFVNPNAHEPLVDRATWEAAQVAKGVSPSKGGPSLLTGIIRCAGCRHGLKPDKMTDKNRGERLPIYRCRGHHASGTCTQRASTLARVVEPWVIEQFFARVDDLIAGAEEDTAAIERTAAALADAEAELSAYRDDTRIADLLGRDSFLEGLKKRADAVEDARSTLAEARSSAAPMAFPAQDLRELWNDLEVDEKRMALRSVIDAVMLRRGGKVPIERRALILWRGEAPDDLPRRGLNRVPITPFVWPEDPPTDTGMPSRQD